MAAAAKVQRAERTAASPARFASATALLAASAAPCTPRHAETAMFRRGVVIAYSIQSGLARWPHGGRPHHRSPQPRRLQLPAIQTTLAPPFAASDGRLGLDRKSTRLNS